jgi:hypothetical protein
MSYVGNVEIETLIGKTLIDIRLIEKDEGVLFICEDGSQFSMHHEPECCECVYLHDVSGSWLDLIDSPVVRAEANSNSDEKLPDDAYAADSRTWTYYRIGTAKGTVVLRWLGMSNGYYSESVSFIQTEEARA